MYTTHPTTPYNDQKYALGIVAHNLSYARWHGILLRRSPFLRTKFSDAPQTNYSLITSALRSALNSPSRLHKHVKP